MDCSGSDLGICLGILQLPRLFSATSQNSGSSSLSVNSIKSKNTSPVFISGSSLVLPDSLIRQGDSGDL